MELLDSKTLVKKFHKFFEEYKRKEIKQILHEDREFIELSFFEISEYDIELGDQLLSYPQDILKIMEITLSEFLEEDYKKTIKIRLTSLPATEQLMIRNIRSEHIGKLILLEGLVRRKTDVRPRLTYSEYLCTNPSCSYSENKLKLPQLEDKAKALKACPKCKSQIELVNKILVDSQNLVLEEIPEHLENSSDQPKRVNVLLQEDLVSPFKDSKTNPGSRVYIIGMVREIPLTTKTGSESINYEIVVDANYIGLSEDDYSEIVISKEEEKQIKELAKKEDVVDILIKNTAPSIYGYNRIKESILLQLFGGVGGTKGDGVKTRGDIHILLVGDPGAAKSQLLKAAIKVAPKSSFVSGKSASGVGLCVSPKSKILTNPGGIQTIENVVEDNFKNPILYRKGILKEDNIKDVKIQSMSSNYKIHSKNPKSIWKLKAPEFIYEITLQSGKKIEITANTKLFSIKNGKTLWIKSSDLKLNDYVATPRILIGGNNKKVYLIDLIDSNPIILDCDDVIKQMVSNIKKIFGDVRNFSKKYGFKENNLYHNWVKSSARGNIKLNDLKKLSKLSNINYKDKVSKLSLYHGKVLNIPIYLNKDILYLAGLIAGDGDIRETKTKSFSIRFSNSNESLSNEFIRILVENFKLDYDITKSNSKRPKAIRTHSRLLGEILLKLGIPTSPKSNKINFSEILLHLDDKLLSYYITGLFDSDGSVSIRKNSKSGKIDFTSCSEDLIKNLQLVLLRYGIYSKIRSREPTSGRIKGKHVRWVLEITNLDNIKKFFSNFRTRHSEKQKKLLNLMSLEKSNTNLDIIPTLNLRLKKELLKNKISLRKINYRDSLSRNGIYNLLRKINFDSKELKEIKNIVNSDIFWEKIININKKKTNYEYVYDLTVDKSHNFVVDGILVHNTATVVKDDLTKGWALEAGAIVLASGGVCAIDELDKMSEEDTSAMHEALEQQCYHYDFELQFADGSTQKIGEYVDNLFNENKNNIIPGIDCEILNIKTKKLLTSNFNKNSTIIPQRISRHKPYKKYFQITFSNGRSITVTPNHPIFVYNDNQISKLPANLVEKGMLIPAPRHTKYGGLTQKLISVKLSHKNNKKIYFPKFLDPSLSKLLGYHASEGHSHYNPKNRYAEIGISNCDKDFNEDCYKLFEAIFKTHINKNIQRSETRKKATKDLFTIRCSSIPLYKFFELNFSELLKKASQKRIPLIIKKSKITQRLNFLEGYFKGDGFIDSERLGYSTSSYGMACDLQDLLLSLGIYSYIATEKRGIKKYYKVVISGNNNIKLFLNKIVKKDHREEKLKKLLERSKRKLNDRDLIPYEFLIPFNDFLKKVHVSDGYFVNNIKRKQNAHRDVVLKYFKKAKDKLKTIKDDNLKIQARDIEFFLNSEIRYLKIKDIKIIKDNKNKWVYDVTVLPNNIFISQGLILHNTISIAKANIRATLKCETTVLGAANPKFGRFDPYGDISKQINFPPALMSRFDLIFILRDIPDKKKDSLIADHILQTHKDRTKTVTELTSNFIKKYIAYTKTIKPVLTQEAIDKIRDFYIKIRNLTNDEEEGVKSVAITARQLEAIVRLSEAYAKIKLDKKVKEEYAQKAIDLIMYCLEKIGIDPKTGELDIDRITTGVTASTRNQYKIIQQIIDKLEVEKPDITYDDICDEAEKQKISRTETQRILDKLKQEGIIFEPRKNIYKKLL